jgi:3-phenylpropionate/trans-cinnamate dioxygenase ferredoxin reductase subunit
LADRSVDFLLIGGGVAAASCARRLREEGAEGSILLVGREQEPPYDRPPLSKGYLRGESSREDAQVVPSGWWEDNGVELLTRTSAMSIDPGGRTVKLSTKEEVGFGKALLATGANVRRLRADGGDLDGIHYLRAFGN